MSRLSAGAGWPGPMLRPPQVLLPAADASQRRGRGSGPPAGPCSHHPEVTAGQGVSDLGTLSPVGPRLWVTPPRGGTRTSRGQRGSGAGGERAGSAQLQRRLSAARTPLPVVVNTLSVRVCMRVWGVRVCACVSMRVRMCACMCAPCVMCVHMCVKQHKPRALPSPPSPCGARLGGTRSA